VKWLMPDIRKKPPNRIRPITIIRSIVFLF